MIISYTPPLNLRISHLDSLCDHTSPVVRTCLAPSTASSKRFNPCLTKKGLVAQTPSMNQHSDTLNLREEADSYFKCCRVECSYLIVALPASRSHFRERSMPSHSRRGCGLRARSWPHDAPWRIFRPSTTVIVSLTGMPEL